MGGIRKKKGQKYGGKGGEGIPNCPKDANGHKSQLAPSEEGGGGGGAKGLCKGGQKGKERMGNSNKKVTPCNSLHVFLPSPPIPCKLF